MCFELKDTPAVLNKFVNNAQKPFVVVHDPSVSDIGTHATLFSETLNSAHSLLNFHTQKLLKVQSQLHLCKHHNNRNFLITSDVAFMLNWWIASGFNCY
jgi:hypothetical protein